MMCSTWKISVFGIIALMFAFGLATTDVMAAKGTLTVTHVVAEPAIANNVNSVNAAAESHDNVHRKRYSSSDR